MAKIKEMYGRIGQFPTGGNPLSTDIKIDDCNFYTVDAFNDHIRIYGELEGVHGVYNISIKFPTQKAAKAFLRGLPKFKDWTSVKEHGFTE